MSPANNAAPIANKIAEMIVMMIPKNRAIMIKFNWLTCILSGSGRD